MPTKSVNIESSLVGLRLKELYVTERRKIDAMSLAWFTYLTEVYTSIQLRFLSVSTRSNTLIMESHSYTCFVNVKFTSIHHPRIDFGFCNLLRTQGFLHRISPEDIIQKRVYAF